jgi:N-acetyl-anhydromuramyl-L-alanine amidase AmpD
MGSILVDGHEFTCAANVRADNTFKFSALPKRTETRAFVIHHTGGLGLAKQVHRTLVERHLSVHFCVEPDGTVWQYADAALRCSHAGIANAWSVGVEVVNHAGPRLVGAEHRPVLIEKIHGADRRHTGFTAEQMTAVLALATSVCRAYGLPLEVPMAAPGHDVVADVLPDPELKAFRGCLGHLHISAAKTDPGLAILRAIAALKPRAGIGLSGPAE